MKDARSTAIGGLGLTLVTTTVARSGCAVARARGCPARKDGLESTPHRSAVVRVLRKAADPPAARTITCSSCHLRKLCLPSDMAEAELASLDRLMFARRRVLAGQTLYSEGDRFQFIYAVRTGTLKSSLMLSDGREQVSDFHIAGEVLGLDGAAHGHHASSAVALEDADICAIPYGQLTGLASGASVLHDAVSRLMSREIRRERELMMLLGRIYADERLAAFLVNLSQRFAARGRPGREFRLPMARAEIGSHLGMKLETVSRTFSAFQQQNLLQVNNRDVRIIDMEGLKRLLEWGSRIDHTDGAERRSRRGGADDAGPVRSKIVRLEPNAVWAL